MARDIHAEIIEAYKAGDMAKVKKLEKERDQKIKDNNLEGKVETTESILKKLEEDAKKDKPGYIPSTDDLDEEEEKQKNKDKGKTKEVKVPDNQKTKDGKYDPFTTFSKHENDANAFHGNNLEMIAAIAEANGVDMGVAADMLDSVSFWGADGQGYLKGTGITMDDINSISDEFEAMYDYTLSTLDEKEKELIQSVRNDIKDRENDPDYKGPTRPDKWNDEFDDAYEKQNQTPATGTPNAGGYPSRGYTDPGSNTTKLNNKPITDSGSQPGQDITGVIPTAPSIDPAMIQDMLSNAQGQISGIANSYNPTFVEALKPLLMSGDEIADMFGIVNDRDELEAALLSIVDGEFALRKSEQARNEDLFYDELGATQNTVLDTLGKNKINAIQSGASKGAQAAQELSAILGLSQQGVQGATALSDMRHQMAIEEGTARSEAQAEALTLANQIGQALANTSSQIHNSNMVGYGSELNYNSALEANIASLLAQQLATSGQLSAAGMAAISGQDIAQFQGNIDQILAQMQAANNIDVANINNKPDATEAWFNSMSPEQKSAWMAYQISGTDHAYDRWLQSMGQEGYTPPATGGTGTGTATDSKTTEPSFLGKAIDGVGNILDNAGKVIGNLFGNPYDGLNRTGTTVDDKGNILDAKGNIIGQIQNGKIAVWDGDYKDRIYYEGVDRFLDTSNMPNNGNWGWNTGTIPTHIDNNPPAGYTPPVDNNLGFTMDDLLGQYKTYEGTADDFIGSLDQNTFVNSNWTLKELKEILYGYDNSQDETVNQDGNYSQ